MNFIFSFGKCTFLQNTLPCKNTVSRLCYWKKNRNLIKIWIWKTRMLRWMYRFIHTCEILVLMWLGWGLGKSDSAVCGCHWCTSFCEELGKSSKPEACDPPESTAWMQGNINKSCKEQEELEWDLLRKRKSFSVSYEGYYLHWEFCICLFFLM